MAIFNISIMASTSEWTPTSGESYRDNPYFDDCAAFCEKWDQASFDPDYGAQQLSSRAYGTGGFRQESL